MPKPLAQRRSPRDIEIASLSARLAEAEETLDAIRSGNVDALIVSGPDGDQIYTLRSGDHRYRRLVESMNEGAASLMPDGTVLYCNARFADLVGAPLERVMGAGLQRFVASTSREALELLLVEGAKGRARGEMELVTHGGALVPVYLSVTANAPGEDPGFCLIATNLTAQKQHEQTAAAGHIAASILEQSTEAIVVCDADHRIVRSSRAAHTLAQRDVLHRAFGDVFTFADATDDATADMLETALAGDAVRGIEARIVDADGITRSLLLSAGPLLNSQDEIVGCVVSLTDITTRAQAETERANLLRREQAARARAEALTAELRASEERASLLARASAALAASLDGAMTLHNVARIGLPSLGDWCCVYMLDESLERIDVVEVAHNDATRTDAIRGTITRSLASGLPDAVRAIVAAGRGHLECDLAGDTLRSIAHDDTHLALLESLGTRSWVGVPLVVQGRVIGALTFGSTAATRRFEAADFAFAEEIASRSAVAIDNARLFEAARRERARVEEANRAKDIFIATVSHELRTPLNAIVGWSRMLRSDSVPENKRARALETIERNAKLQTELIEGLLDISRIVSGKLRLEARTVYPCEIVDAAVEASRLAAEAKGVRLETRLDRDIGPIVGDADRLIQVVSNLVTNAIKFTPKGGRADVALHREGDEIEISVTDTGVGIGREFLPYVFDRFRQADGATTRAHGGLGLGLAIVKHLVELHGGTIRAESEGDGLGARFVVRIPSAPPTAASTDAVSPRTFTRPSVAFSDTPQVLAGLKVLVVDDEPDARELLVAVLERCEVEVTAAGSAEAALEAVERIRPDVLISDIAMPGADGYALIQQVRLLGPDRGGQTPAAALTAFARLEDRTRALLAGFQMHVSKPIEPAALVAVIATLSGRAG